MSCDLVDSNYRIVSIYSRTGKLYYIIFYSIVTNAVCRCLVSILCKAVIVNRLKPDLQLDCEITFIFDEEIS